MYRHLIILGTTCALIGLTLGSLLHPISSPVDLCSAGTGQTGGVCSGRFV